MDSKDTQQLATKSRQIQLTEAFINFSKPFQLPVNPSTFEHHLSILQQQKMAPQLITKITPFLIERYYQIINQQINLEEFLLLKFLAIIKGCLIKIKAEEQMLIVFIWTSVSKLKKINVSKQHRQLILQILSTMQVCVGMLEQIKSFNFQSIYPQISSLVLKYIVEIIDFRIFRESLGILSKLLVLSLRTRAQSQKIMAPKSWDSDIIKLDLDILDPQERFDYQCILRLQSNFKALSINFGSKPLNFKSQFLKFLNDIRHLPSRFPKLLVPYYILYVTAGGQISFSQLKSTTVQLVKSSLTDQFMSLLSTQESQGSKTDLLHRILALSPYISLRSENKTEKIVQLLINRICLFQNSHNLVIPHNPVAYTTHLVQLKGEHSFSNYSMPITTLIQSFEFELNRFLVSKLPYCEMHLQNITILKQLFAVMPNDALQEILEALVVRMSSQEAQYMVNMNLTKFAQYLTKLIVIYWIVSSKKYEPSRKLAESLFQNIINCQAIRILEPSFKQEEFLIGMTLLTAHYCYTKALSKSQPLQKLKKKISLLQITINNIFEQSFPIKLSAYYILLVEAAPSTIDAMLENLQSTLINRNLHHFKFLIALIKLCSLASNQAEDLANKLILSKRAGTEQLLNIIFTSLSTQMMRKCVLSASSRSGRWAYMLLNNTKFLYNKSISENQTNSESQSQNFYMNDGQNVQISNALGVIILELGEKWQHSLNLQCPTKQITLDVILEIMSLNTNMVFFRQRFSSIFKSILTLLPEIITSSNVAAQRIKSKIYHIIDTIPPQNFKIYINPPKQIQPQYSIKTFTPTSIQDLNKTLILLEQNHKQQKLKYFSNPTNQNQHKYNMSDRICNKLRQICQKSDST